LLQAYCKQEKCGLKLPQLRKRNFLLFQKLLAFDFEFKISTVKSHRIRTSGFAAYGSLATRAAICSSQRFAINDLQVFRFSCFQSFLLYF